MKLLQELYNISSPSRKEGKMIQFICNYLDNMQVSYCKDKLGNIYVTKGTSKSYPCVVCHTDEVHQNHTTNYEVVNLRGEIIFGYDSCRREHAGIGADDKNGIWICLQTLRKFKNIKCVFFVAEEIGCVGSSNADMEFFNDCRFVLQCDRKGNSDLITKANGLPLCSDAFVKAVNPKSYGYKPANGMMTDVFTLKEKGLGVSCVNISCGYYYPHSEHEFTNIQDLKKCLEFVTDIIRKCRSVYPHSKPERKQKRSLFEDDVFFGKPSFFQTGNIIRGWDEPLHRTYSFQVEYDDMLREMSDMLGNNINLKLSEIREILSGKFLQMRRSDYRLAYEEIMGCPPPNESAVFPKINTRKQGALLQEEVVF